MSQKIEIDHVEHDLDSLSLEAKDILEKLQYTEEQIQYTNNLCRLLKRAKKKLHSGTTTRSDRSKVRRRYCIAL